MSPPEARTEPEEEEAQRKRSGPGVNGLIRWLRLGLLAVVWVFFFQVPFYVSDLPGLYAVSKVGITAVSILLLLVVLGALAVSRFSVPNWGFVIVTCGVLLTVSTLSSLHWFGQNPLDGIAGQTKVLAGSYFFGVVGLLSLMRIRLTEVRTSVLVAAWVVLALAYALSFGAEFLPASLTADGESRLLRYDEIRGTRVILQVFLIEILMFYEWRRFLSRGFRGTRHLVVIGLGMSFIGILAGQRTESVSVLVVILIVSVVGSGRAFVRLGGGLLAISGAVALATLIGAFGRSALLAAGAVRVGTAQQILSVLGEVPSRWTFGMGNLSRVSGGQTFQDLYGTAFWPTDVGWLGVVFEFGLLGSALVLWWYIRVFRSLGQVAPGEPENGHFVGGLRDLVLKMLIASPLSPAFPMFLGLGATLLAFGSYYRADRGRSP